MILIEGPDGAGKTTLGRNLCDRYHLTFGERGTKDRKLLYTVTRSDTYTALGHAVKGDGPVHVWDRLYYSELVYAPIVGRTCEFNPIEQGFIERMINALACPVVVCLPPLETVVKNAHQDEQMDGVLENLKNIYQWYSDLLVADRFPEDTVVYDYTKENGAYEAICIDIDEYLLERRHRTWA